jgi:hypothetical protein
LCRDHARPDRRQPSARFIYGATRQCREAAIRSGALSALLRRILLARRLNSRQNSQPDQHDCKHPNPVRRNVHQVRAVHQTDDQDRVSGRIQSERHGVSSSPESAQSQRLDCGIAAASRARSATPSRCRAQYNRDGSFIAECCGSSRLPGAPKALSSGCASPICEDQKRRERDNVAAEETQNCLLIDNTFVPFG